MEEKPRTIIPHPEEEDKKFKSSFKSRHYWSLRLRAMTKIRSMIDDLNRLLAKRLIREEQERLEKKQMAVSTMVLIAVFFFILFSAGVFTVNKTLWHARFILQSAWATDSGNLRIVIAAHDLTVDEKSGGIEDFTASVIDPEYRERIKTEIMPIYLKNGNILLQVVSERPVAIPGECDLKLEVVNKKGKKKQIQISNLLRWHTKNVASSKPTPDRS